MPTSRASRGATRKGDGGILAALDTNPRRSRGRSKTIKKTINSPPPEAKKDSSPGDDDASTLSPEQLPTAVLVSTLAGSPEDQDDSSSRDDASSLSSSDDEVSLSPPRRPLFGHKTAVSRRKEEQESDSEESETESSEDEAEESSDEEEDSSDESSSVDSIGDVASEAQDDCILEEEEDDDESVEIEEEDEYDPDEEVSASSSSDTEDEEDLEVDEEDEIIELVKRRAAVQPTEAVVEKEEDEQVMAVTEILEATTLDENDEDVEEVYAVAEVVEEEDSEEEDAYDAPLLEGDDDNDDHESLISGVRTTSEDKENYDPEEEADSNDVGDMGSDRSVNDHDGKYAELGSEIPDTLEIEASLNSVLVNDDLNTEEQVDLTPLEEEKDDFTTYGGAMNERNQSELQVSVDSDDCISTSPEDSPTSPVEAAFECVAACNTNPSDAENRHEKEFSSDHSSVSGGHLDLSTEPVNESRQSELEFSVDSEDCVSKSPDDSPTTPAEGASECVADCKVKSSDAEEMNEEKKDKEFSSIKSSVSDGRLELSTEPFSVAESLIPISDQEQADNFVAINDKEMRPRLRRTRSDGEVRQGKWSVGAKLGVGSFGVVHVGMNKKTGTLMAVKSVELSPQVMTDIRREVELLKALDHVNIVRYLGAERSGTHLHIFQEWVAGGSVTSLLHKFGAFSMPVVRNYLCQILAGLEYLHENKVLHRDIKGGNVLVSNDGIVKLADFGSSRKLAHLQADMMEKQTVRGTPYFMAPEVFEETYGSKADIWSVGCVAFQMATGSPPWKNMKLTNPISLCRHLHNTQGPPPFDWPVERHDTKHFPTFLQGCFQRDPSKRPSAEELMRDTFIIEAVPSSDEEQSRGLFSPGGESASTWGTKDKETKDELVVVSGPSFLSPTMPTRIKPVRQEFVSPLPPSPNIDPREWPAWARERHAARQQNPTGQKMMDSLALSEDTSLRSNPFRRRLSEGSGVSSKQSASTLDGLEFLTGS